MNRHCSNFNTDNTTSNLPILTPFEVAVHNTPNDCWISFLGKIYNLTSLVKKYHNDKCIKPILAFAGKDVSHWFDNKTGEIQKYINPLSYTEVPYMPHGRLPEVPLFMEVPSSKWHPINDVPWWKNDNKYQVGILTKRCRPLRIINTLILKETKINVCMEDTFYRIQERYSPFNSDGDSYYWRYLERYVDMSKTLDENGIPDERDLMVSLGIPQSSFIPCVFIDYKDDLKYYMEEDPATL